jgi:hypothetical protein
VFAETFRVLQPGGRIGVTDVVAEDDLTPEQRAERGPYVECIADAPVVRRIPRSPLHGGARRAAAPRGHGAVSAEPCRAGSPSSPARWNPVATASTCSSERPPMAAQLLPHHLPGRGSARRRTWVAGHLGRSGAGQDRRLICLGVIELQARRTCAVLGGEVASPERDRQLAGIAAERKIRERRPRPQFPHRDYVEMADSLATELGGCPSPGRSGTARWCQPSTGCMNPAPLPR